MTSYVYHETKPTITEIVVIKGFKSCKTSYLYALKSLPYTVITGDTTDPTSLVTLHLYCPVVLVVYDILLLLSTVIQFPESFLSQ